jgi:hypothetical protein
MAQPLTYSLSQLAAAAQLAQLRVQTSLKLSDQRRALGLACGQASLRRAATNVGGSEGSSVRVRV